MVLPSAAEMRSLTPVEAAVAVAIAGSVLAAALPAFVKNLHASRLVEPVDGVSRIAARATALAHGRSLEEAFPESVPRTPERVPRGERVTDPPGTWEHPTWRALEFAWTVPHSFSFAFESKNTPAHATFRASAHGDLDGDGVLSTFEISGMLKPQAEPHTEPMVVSREVE
jgi:hypothetical protein